MDTDFYTKMKASFRGVFDLLEWLWDNIVEILIVLAIIGIMAAIAIPSINRARAVVRNVESGELKVDDEFLVKEVPGGWIYYSRYGARGMVFVPKTSQCLER